MAKVRRRPRRIRVKSSSLTVRETTIGPTVLLDSSFVLAALDLADRNCKPVRSLLGFLEPHNCKFHIPLYVFAEVVSKLIHKGQTVSEAFKALKRFQERLHGVMAPGNNPSLSDLTIRYKALAKNQIRLLQSNDFYIATEGILAKAIVLTCDKNMYDRVVKSYKDIFYVAASSKKYDDDIPRFARRFLELV